MMNQELLMSPNRLVTFLQKPAAEFTKADIINSEFCDKQCFLSGCHPDLW